nr:hypothetical protein [uncultured Oscillibacter sp.]
MRFPTINPQVPEERAAGAAAPMGGFSEGRPATDIPSSGAFVGAAPLGGPFPRNRQTPGRPVPPETAKPPGGPFTPTNKAGT